MKKTPLLNIALSRVIASLGHGDVLVIGDAGLPVPPGVELIDLALTAGVPATGRSPESGITDAQPARSGSAVRKMKPKTCFSTSL